MQSNQQSQNSLLSCLSQLPDSMRSEILGRLTTAEKAALAYSWAARGRPDQQEPPGDWSTWLALAGRGWGKTETGAQWIKQRVENGAMSVALVAETQKDLEEVMVPRIINIHPPHLAPSVRFRPVRMKWPNGAIALGYVGNEPDQLRGPEFDTAWVDELAKYRRARDVWDMLQMTMRSGDNPRVMVTTTPRPIPIIRALVSDPTVHVTRGRTFDNAANLAAPFLDQIRRRYEGTRLGRQELDAEVLEDLPGALWSRSWLDNKRVHDVPSMQRIVVAIDPSGSAGAGDDGDSQGIVVAGLGIDGRGYVLADRSCKLSPDGWARQAIEAYHEFRADRIVAESNYGGAMVEAVLRAKDRTIPYKAVTASRGKVLRAEPIAALYEQGRVSHVGHMPELEDQCCLIGPGGYAGEGSPDRLDALVWALTELMLHSNDVRIRTI